MNNIGKIGRVKYYYAMMDFLVLSISFVFTIYMMMLNYRDAERFITPVFTFVIFLITLSILLIFEFNRLYTEDVIRSRSKQLSAVIKSLAAGSFYIFLITIVIMSLRLQEIGVLLLAFSAIAFSLLYLIRIEILGALVFKEKQKTRNVLFIGDGGPGREIAASILADGRSSRNIIGFLHSSEDQVDMHGSGNLNELPSLADSEKIDEVIISYNDVPLDNLFEVIDKCIHLNLKTRVASEMFRVISDNFITEKYYGVPLIDISPSAGQTFLKRFMDIVLSLTALILLSPLLIIIAILIKITSRGPVLYKHQRIGLNGTTFEFYKFRSMTVSDEDDESRKEMMLRFMKEGITQDDTAKIINSDRLTPIGAFLRKYSIDELPQLFNVIKGEMSLVGPRPCLPYEYENYEWWHKKRVSVIPGCTGVWQITGRSRVSFNESVLLDLYYINRSSVLFDLWIVLKTIPVIVFSRGGK